MGCETEVHSVAAAIQNMLLRAHDLGLGRGGADPS
jgi:hypothetical protein